MTNSLTKIDAGVGSSTINPLTAPSTEFAAGTSHAIAGQQAAVVYKMEDSSIRAEDMGGLWPTVQALVQWAFMKEWTAANTGDNLAGAPVVTTLNFAVNSGTNKDVVANMNLMALNAAGGSGFCENNIVYSYAGATGATHRCGEDDMQPYPGIGALGFGRAYNKFSDVETMNANYVCRFGTASWANAYVVGGSKYGLVPESDYSGSYSTTNLINTNSSHTYADNTPIHVANGHKMRFAGTSSVHSYIWNAANYLQIQMGSAGLAVKTNDGTTTGAFVNNNGFSSWADAAFDSNFSMTLGGFGNTEGQGLLQLVGADATASLQTYMSRGAAGNAAACTIRGRANSVTGRSINAGGTINAAGADSAEYERKASLAMAFAKGQVVGFDADGLLTDRYADAISFLIKSTNPHLVGGDEWAMHLGEPPTLVEFEPGVYEGPPPSGPCQHDPVSQEDAEAALEAAVKLPSGDAQQAVLRDNAIARANRKLALVGAHEAHIANQEAHEAAVAAFERDESARKTAWQKDVLGPYRAALMAHEAAHDAERQWVDRIAYSGKVPLNMVGAKPGQVILPVANADGSIGVEARDMASSVHALAILGTVRRVLDDGRPLVVVNPNCLKVRMDQ